MYLIGQLIILVITLVDNLQIIIVNVLIILIAIINNRVESYGILLFNQRLCTFKNEV